MRRVSWILVLLTIAFFNLGMGELGSAPQEGMSAPETDSRAVIVDRAGERIELDRFTMNGKTAIEGVIGKGQVTIPFANIQTVEFSEEGKNELSARLSLNGDREVTLMVRPSETFYGDTGFGTYTVRARDLKTIEFPDTGY